MTNNVVRKAINSQLEMTRRKLDEANAYVNRRAKEVKEAEKEIDSKKEKLYGTRMLLESAKASAMALEDEKAELDKFLKNL